MNIEEYDLLIEAANAAIERKDPPTAFQNFQTAALHYGFPYAQYSLGLCYLYGYGTEADPEKSEYFLLLAAGQDHKPAQNQLGKEYFEGENFEQDYEKAFKWLKEADDGTDLEVCQMLGECYECGLGVRENPAKAFQYYKQAFDLDPDNSFSRLLMGECYCEGTCVKQNYDLAIEYLTPVQDELDAAKIALGKCYLFGKKDAYTSALLFNQVTTEDFKEEADELLVQALAQLPDDQLQDFMDAIESSDADDYEEEDKETTSSADSSFSFSNVPSDINISVSTTYSKK